MSSHFHELEEFLKFLKKEQINMQVQLSISFNVTGVAPPPLVVTPPTVTENLTVGVPADGTAVASVTGGTPPYTYSLDPASGSLPPGIGLSEDGSGNITLTGTPTTAGVSTTPVLLNITDAAGATTSASVASKAVKPIL